MILPFPFLRRKRLFTELAVQATIVFLPVVAYSQPQEPQDAAADTSTVLGAEQLTGRPEEKLILEGEVEIMRDATELTAERASYDVVEDQVEAVGDINVQRPGELYTGDELKLRLETGEGYVLNPTYRFEANNAQGRASRIDFLSSARARISEGTYSTCEGPDPDWYLQSKTINLDQERDVGSASNTVLYFKDVPIFGSPYFSFPLSNERKTGFLTPTAGVSSNGGFQVLTPYYLNIAPSRDLTLYPQFFSKRGFQLGMRGRYLGETYSGETSVEGMLNDTETDEGRYAISTRHVQTLGSHVQFASNLNAASDNDYPNDFSSSITAASQRLLARDINLSYAGSFWNASARTTTFQVLQDPRNRIANPYERLPQLSFLANQLDVDGLGWSMFSEFTSFRHPDSARIEGDRLIVNPRVSYSIIEPGYFIKPSVSLHGSLYNLSRQEADAPSSLSRLLPTMSVDSGLVFERDALFLGEQAVQTLEPRLFYVYTPYKNQQFFPKFDTSLADFNFAQIFRENRFSGHDLISDTNQLTAALVSRYIEPTGTERFRLAFAQRYYFDPQRVVAQQTAGVTVEESRSDILLAASGQVSPALALDLSMQYSQNLNATSRAFYGVRWQPTPERLLSLQYRKDMTNQIELADISAKWPLAARWYGAARLNYSLPEDKIIEQTVGLEYRADCWSFRLAGQRTPTATGVATTKLLLQLELNGLSRISSD